MKEFKKVGQRLVGAALHGAVLCCAVLCCAACAFLQRETLNRDHSRQMHCRTVLAQSPRLTHALRFTRVDAWLHPLLLPSDLAGMRRRRIGNNRRICHSRQPESLTQYTAIVPTARRLLSHEPPRCDNITSQNLVSSAAPHCTQVQHPLYKSMLLPLCSCSPLAGLLLTSPELPTPLS